MKTKSPSSPMTPSCPVSFSCHCELLSPLSLRAERGNLGGEKGVSLRAEGVAISVVGYSWGLLQHFVPRNDRGKPLLKKVLLNSDVYIKNKRNYICYNILTRMY